MKRQAAAYLVLMTVLLCASGASCPTLRQPLASPAPTLFAGPPTQQEVIAAINATSGQIRQLQTDSATLSVQGMPTLRASLAAGPPRNFRLRASFIGVGEVLDLGSNDQVFWAMVDAPQLMSEVPRAVYYARHDQYLHSAARQVLPIQPQWLVEAFGLIQLDPAGRHEGPYQRGPGELEIRTRTPSPEGDVTKILVLHDRFGWIQQQHWYDARGTLMASVFASQHQYEPALGISLPIYPAKGYSVTMPVKDASMAHQVSLTDDEYKLVYSNLGTHLRVAGTAELSGYSRTLNYIRCKAIVDNDDILRVLIERLVFEPGLPPKAQVNQTLDELRKLELIGRQ